MFGDCLPFKREKVIDKGSNDLIICERHNNIDRKIDEFENGNTTVFYNQIDKKNLRSSE